MKKTLLFITAMIVAASVLANKFPAETPSGHTLYFEVVDYYNNYVKVTFPGNNNSWDGYTKPSGNIVIPASITVETNSGLFLTYTVVGVGSNAFRECTNITSVHLGSSITYLGSSSFKGCASLNSFDFGQSNVDSIDNWAFSQCTSLSSISLPEGLRTIKSQAFSLTGLTALVIPNSVTKVELLACHDNRNLQTLTIGNGVTSIGTSAFSGCPSLRTVTLGSSVRSIGNDAFGGSEYVNDLYYNGTLDQWCEIEFGNQGSSIFNNRFFVGNSLITDLIIPSGVRKLKQFAFCGMSGIQSITLPTSVIEMEVDAIATIDDITPFPLYYEGTLTQWLNMTKQWNGGITFNLHCQGQLMEHISIPPEITELKDYALSGTGSLVSITIPETIRHIGHCAIGDCNNLREIKVLSSEPASAADGFCSCSGSHNWRLVVPCGARNNYLTAPGWEKFQEEFGGIYEDCEKIDDDIDGNIIITAYDGIIDISNTENESISVIDICGRVICHVPHTKSIRINVARGVYIVKIGTRTVRKIVSIK